MNIDNIINEWSLLREFIKEVEFSDDEYKKQFEKVNYYTLEYFTSLCSLRAFKKEYDDITYVKQVKGIINTICKKEKITYNQFRVLCFFWKRIKERENNPIKKTFINN